MITNNLVVKVASRCNLNCNYCYVYNMGDTSYKLQPKFMTQNVIESLLLRIKDNCIKNNLNEFLIVFHGGEPLLTGIGFYENFIKTQKKIIPKEIRIDYAMQSNGTLLNDEIALNLKKLNIQVGISIDGTSKSNSINRVGHKGESMYLQIVNGFNSIKNVFGNDFANCLCVIDVSDDPKDVYQHFKKLEANNVHFLFQDFNYINSDRDDVPKIGKWLVEMFDLWIDDKELKKPNVRPFSDLINLIFGFGGESEIFGCGINKTLVIETDGSIETVDTLKTCGDGFTKTCFNVLNDDLNIIYKHSELARLYYYSHDKLCETCEVCLLKPICGGGFIGHRYSLKNNFNNPSIYCKEIIQIICHIQNELLKRLSKEVLQKLKLENLNYNEIIKDKFSDE